MVNSFEFLYQDQHFIAVNKPAGLLTIPDGYNRDLPNLRTLLLTDFKQVLTVHRLDKDTSGVVIFALTPESHRALSILFEHRNVKKEYRAIIFGVLDLNDFTIDFPLRVNGDRKHRTVVDQSAGKPAVTLIKVVNKYTDYELISAFPLSGYTHQIRAHLAAIDHPILNDRFYGGKTLDRVDLSMRLMLHAFNISFIHPFFNTPLEITSPLPVEFIDFLKNKEGLTN